jgi:mannose-6-phosphate isomerase-like protein (cupin superfamily)
MEVKIVRKDESRNFMDGNEHCREYFVTEKITFGTSTLLPGQRGEIDKGHPASHEVFFVVRGHILLYVKEQNKYFELFTEDAIIMPEGVSHTLINIGEETAVLSWSKAPSEL